MRAQVSVNVDILFSSNEFILTVIQNASRTTPYHKDDDVPDYTDTLESSVSNCEATNLCSAPLRGYRTDESWRRREKNPEAARALGIPEASE